ncbi:hypothetical protein BGX29_004854 [Mortierella sp. GBA35]|nr:hypothetical protein BGX29_004854 [Mortierella sp. GBA35]
MAIPLHSVTASAHQPLSGNVRTWNNEQAVLGVEDVDNDSKSTLFGPRHAPMNPTWQVLGPFPTGMREQDFGADPLEAFGGFRQLEYDTKAKFPSELALDGVVGWHTTKMDHDGWVSVHYPDIKWEFNQRFLGWGFNQFQAWARTTFTVPNIKQPPYQQNEHIRNNDGLVSITIQCQNVGDFYVNDNRLSGDWYAYGLTRHTLRLKPGTRHTLSVRVVHEVRIFGGVILPPPSKFKCDLRLPFPFGHDGSENGSGPFRPMVQVVEEGTGGVMVMDAVDGVLAGEYVSVALRNVGGKPVVVKSVRVVKGSDGLVAQLADHENKEGIRIYPSTHRPIAIQLKSQARSAATIEGYRGGEFSLQFETETQFTEDSRKTGSTGFLTTKNLTIAHRTWGEPYIYTFRDFDGTVHYAAAIPPSDPISQPSDSAPVLVALHGAGVETAQSPFWLSEYTQRERTWIILPTGRSPWGYDWHGASIKDVFNAIESLARDLPGVPERLKHLSGMKPDPDRLFMAGHSNGGQGAWFLSTHFPDKAIAVTPAAGYVNIKQYVPFSSWLKSSIVEFDNDVHMSNTVGLPILARTGSVDDNVPPFHSRKMVRLGQENAHNTTAIRLSEVPGEGHWFTGVLQDAEMLVFLKQHLHDDIITLASQSSNTYTADKAQAVVHPPFPSKCEITVINPAGMGSKCGIQVEQLRIPYRKGTIKVEIVKDIHGGKPSSTWVISTKNIRRFGFSGLPSILQRRGRVSQVIINGAPIVLTNDDDDDDVMTLESGLSFVNEDGSSKKGGRWQMSRSDEWRQHERHRETYGPAIQVLEKRVVIVLGSHFDEYPKSEDGAQFEKTADRIAQLVAHDIYQYGRGDVEVITDIEFLARYGDTLEGSSGGDVKMNVVLIGDSHQNSATKLVLGQRKQEVIIDSQEGMVSIHPESSHSGEEYQQPGVGLLMIRPWGPSNLAMVIAGVDPQGLEIAARLFPKRTGMLVPDWIVTGPEMGWKGAGGILAAGYWGNHWEYLATMSA